MEIGPIKRHVLVAAVGACVVPGLAEGQEPRTEFWEELCREAIREVRSVAPSRPLMDLLDIVSGCGPQGGAILADALAQHSAVSDRLVLERLFVRVARIKDRSVFDTALRLAADTAATDLARAVALRVFVKYEVPGWWTRFSDFGLPWDEWGARGRRSPGGTVTHAVLRQGEPLPADWQKQVARVLSEIAARETDSEAARFGARIALRFFESYGRTNTPSR